MRRRSMALKRAIMISIPIPGVATALLLQFLQNKVLVGDQDLQAEIRLAAEQPAGDKVFDVVLKDVAGNRIETQAREASTLARSPLLDLGVALPLALALHLMHEDRVDHELGVLLLHWCHLGRDEIADDLALLALAQIGREGLA